MDARSSAVLALLRVSVHGGRALLYLMAKIALVVWWWRKNVEAQLFSPNCGREKLPHSKRDAANHAVLTRTKI